MSEDFDNPDFETPQPQHPHKSELGSVDDAMAAGVPAAKFEEVGTVVKGTIIDAVVGQQRDLATGKPKFWEDGNPCTQVLITLATADRSADIDDDDGHRRLYVKRPSAMLKAISAALGKVKLSQATGGTLAVKFTGLGEASQKGFNKPKLFAAKFTPANGAAAPTQTASHPPASSGNMTADSRVKAFGIFKDQFPPGTTKEEMAPKWLELIARVCPGKKQSEIDATGWIAVQRHLEGYQGEEADAVPSDIPASDADLPF